MLQVTIQRPGIRTWTVDPSEVFWCQRLSISQARNGMDLGLITTGEPIRYVSIGIFARIIVTETTVTNEDYRGHQTQPTEGSTGGG